jgi:hypothetical protein
MKFRTALAQLPPYNENPLLEHFVCTTLGIPIFTWKDIIYELEEVNWKNPRDPQVVFEMYLQLDEIRKNLSGSGLVDMRYANSTIHITS